MVDFNRDRAKDFATQPAIANGQHAAIVVDAIPHESKKEENDNIMARVFFQKLTDPTDAESRTGPKWSVYPTFPLDNPNVEGHEAPQWSGRMFADFAAAMNDAIPVLPRYDKDEKQTYFKGEVMETRKDTESAMMECINAAGDWSAEIWGEEGSGLEEALVGCVVYCEVSRQDGSNFPSTDNMAIECPEDWELTEDVMYVAEEEEEEEAPKPRKKAKKKAKKKTSRSR